jgi:hypothetical protein
MTDEQIRAEMKRKHHQEQDEQLEAGQMSRSLRATT